MAALDEVIEAELGKLCPRLGQAQVQKIKSHPAPPSRLPGRSDDRPADNVRLPGLSARFFGRSLTLDFSAWAGSACMLAIHLGATSPFKMSLVLQQGRTHGFSRDVVSTADAGVHPRLEEIYMVEALDDKKAASMLSNGDIEELIASLGEFERLTLDPRFFKLSRFFDSEAGITAEAIFEDIERLQQLAEAIEAWQPEDEVPVEAATSV